MNRDKKPGMESVLDDDYPDMAVNGVHGNLEAVDNEAMALLK